MKGMCVAILCLLGVAMVMGGEEEMPPPGGPPSLPFILEEFLDGPARGIVTGIIAGKCREVFAENDIGPPLPPASAPAKKAFETAEKKKLSDLLARYLHRQKRGAEERVIGFCIRFMFPEPVVAP